MRFNVGDDVIVFASSGQSEKMIGAGTVVEVDPSDPTLPYRVDFRHNSDNLAWSCWWLEDCELEPVQ